MENNCCPCWSNCNKFGDNNNIEVNQLKNAASVVKDEPRKQTISILLLPCRRLRPLDPAGSCRKEAGKSPDPAGKQRK